ncbi:MAG: DUF2085 domain-containing protein [Chloroflexi bacterium]|nr:DUF2085 domain-containing protein [Chloroflexota bacterium]
MSTTKAVIRHQSKKSFADWVSGHWLEIFFVVYGIWVWAPWLAPIFMRLGWDGAGRTVYFIYSFFCHQLPERSYFLFGQKTMYSLTEVQAAWQNTINPLILRKFIGNDVMGWKVAWSDRMISFYGSVWIFAVLWLPFRRKIKPLKWWAFALFLLPIAIDGGTHTMSDIAGIGQGFRDTNQWLVALTNNALPASFYAGDALGSFNSWMRNISGLLAGLGIVWLVFPYSFETEVYNQKLEELNYGKVLEQIKSQNPRSSS